MLIRFFLISIVLLSIVSSGVNAKGNDAKVMTSGLNHLGLTVKDLSASKDFFVNTLGWKVAGGYPEYPSVFVTDGQIFVTLWQTKNKHDVIEFDRKNNVGLHHLALTVTSEKILEELHQRFKLLPNIVIEFSPELNGKGPTVHMIIREPSGNRIEFAYSPKK
ncbi:VOC family protein [Colwellia sp. 6M3]|jgi:lactoylglutathione lyase|uniref:VOC family protein n=1 Tax=Colwellia sp. 6M3 TaxID=2759849 RepID=UPI0015F371B6|nr:VOC family protein [Colwellia sp. 6M3]MBA6416631.1 VOC family protein [Colwellia sp. 6M3]|tara:strand:- start:10 stop:495 length:486 start_codon:yes stop_codon:yes gene_type:complete